MLALIPRGSSGMLKFAGELKFTPFAESSKSPSAPELLSVARDAKLIASTCFRE
jgi:hypothetical protein